MPGDESNYRWSTREYSLQELYEANRFPVLIMVTGGFFGETTVETLSSGDIMLLHGRGRQDRVIAKETTSRSSKDLYSIPLDYDMPFAKADNPTRTIRGVILPLKLRSIVEKETLPCQVQMVLNKESSLHLKSDPKVQICMGKLELKEAFQIKFFKATSLLNGSMHNEPFTVPTYLRHVMVVKAEALTSRNATQAQWDRLLGRWYAASEYKIRHSTDLVPSKDIMLYSEESVKEAENVYECIEPVNYVKRSAPPAQTSEVYSEVEINPKPGAPPPPSKAPVQPPAPKPQPKPAVQPPQQKPAQAPKPMALEQRRGSTKQNIYVSCVEPIKRVRDIPQDVSKLSCRDLAQCLRLMKMDSYVKVFEDTQINGSLLSSLDEQMMREDLGVSAIHARKLYMFVHQGWRPDEDHEHS